jgi:hypothetical protein
MWVGDSQQECRNEMNRHPDETSKGWWGGVTGEAAPRSSVCFGHVEMHVLDR